MTACPIAELVDIARAVALRHHRTHPYTEVDDCVQEAMIAAWQAALAFDGRGNASAFIADRCKLRLLHFEREHGSNVRVGRDGNRDVWEPRATPVGSFDEQPGALQPRCEGGFSEAETVLFIMGAREYLSALMFRALVMTALGFDAVEIARADGVADNVGVVRVRKARERLAERMAA